MKRTDATPESQAKVAEQRPDILIPFSEIKAACQHVMKASDELTSDSGDYRLGQWVAADKVLFMLDCAAERIRLVGLRSESGITPTGAVKEWRSLQDELRRKFPADQPKLLAYLPGDQKIGAPSNVSYLAERVIKALDEAIATADEFARLMNERAFSERGNT